PGQRLATRVTRGLIGAGGVELGGGLSGSRWIRNFDELSESQQWMRLVLLEGQRVTSEAAHALLKKVVASTDVAPDLRFQSMRALLAMQVAGANQIQVADWPELLTWAARAGYEDELARLVVALNLEPVREELGGSRRVELFFLDIALLQRDLSGAIAQCLRLGELDERRAREGLVEHLEWARFAVGPGLLRQVAQGAISASNGRTAESLRFSFLLAGALVPVAADGPGPAVAELTAEEFSRLGAFAGVRRGKQARGVLLQAVVAGPKSVAQRVALMGALEHAIRRLNQAAEDALVKQFTNEVRSAAKSPQNVLHSRLTAPEWPRLEPSLVIDLQRLDRER
ncbi:MAG: hypothetical protein ACI9F9_002895, partial [Candidatus Paceibacteria bacterium]